MVKSSNISILNGASSWTQRDMCGVLDLLMCYMGSDSGHICIGVPAALNENAVYITDAKD